MIKMIFIVLMLWAFVTYILEIVRHMSKNAKLSFVKSCLYGLFTALISAFLIFGVVVLF